MGCLGGWPHDSHECEDCQEMIKKAAVTTRQMTDQVAEYNRIDRMYQEAHKLEDQRNKALKEADAAWEKYKLTYPKDKWYVNG